MHWIGRLCEEFHCLPSEAYREWRRVPAGFLEEILEGRAYRAAKRVYDRAATAADVPDDPMIDLVKAIEFELQRADGEQAAGD